jgi:hypothetical protein
VDPSARLDLGLLIGADHELAGLQQPALPAALVQVKHRAGALGEVRVAREQPRAVLPRLDRVLGQPPGDRRRRRNGHAPLDHQPMDLRTAEARDRQPVTGGKLAHDRLDLRDLFRGENDAGDPPAAHPASHQAQPHRTFVATY